MTSVEEEPLLLGSVGVVAEAIPDAIVVVGEDGRILVVNAETERLLGWTREELIGSIVERLVPARLRSRHLQHRLRYQHVAVPRPMGRGVSLAVVTSDGAELPVDISLMPIRSGDARYTVVTIRDLREQRDTETRLAESETRFLTIFQHATLGMALLDAQGRVVQSNYALSELLGYTEGELAGRSAASLLEPRDVGRLASAIGALVRGGLDVREGGVQLRHRDGEIVDAHLSLAAVRAGAGEPLTLLLQVHDANDVQRAREKLAAAEAEYRRLVEEIPLVTYVQQPDGSFEYVSPQAERLLGYSTERWRDDGTFYANVVHPDDRETVLRTRAEELASGRTTESDYRLVRSDGRAVWVHDKSMFELDASGRPLSRRGFLLDVTQRTLAEEARNATEQQLALVFNGVSDLLFLIRVEPGPTYRWLAVNDAFHAVTGLTNELVVGKLVEEILEPEAARLAELRYAETIESPGPTTFREELSTRHGQIVAVETRLTPVFDAEQRCTHLLGASRDISDQQVLESKLREAQKLQAVGRLAGGIAHDFNNLLTVVALAGEHLRGRLDDADRREVEQILAAADRAATLTRQLLAFSRRQVLQPVDLDLNDVVSDMNAMLRRLIGEDIELTTELAPGLDSVNADRSQLEQVIVNLAVNARDAMPRGGRLSIGTVPVEIKWSQAGALGVRPGRYVRLSVSDTGIGMDETVRSSIFEPFFTTKGEAGGSGLGLATVYGIVRQSDGAVEVESAPAEGTTFSVYLPLAGPPPERATAAGGGALPKRVTGTETVLLVEDEGAVRRLGERALSDAGYTVVGASSASEALELAERRPGEIHLVVTDMIMPGMTGLELVEQLRRIRPRVRVLYVSGYTADVLAQRGVLADRIALLEKPFTGNTLAAKVRAVLDADAE